MKKLIVLFFLGLNIGKLIAQESDENPVAYLNAMYNTHLNMDKKYMQYTSAVAHGKRARKVEKLRMQVIEEIEKTRDKISELSYYKGDKTYRESNLKYVEFCYKIFSEDYAKIVNLEEIAEQSIDDLQAYLLLQEKVEEKLKAATDSLNKSRKDFAKKYNVKLIEGEKTELQEKMEQASKVNKYYHPIDIIFFKCNWQFNKLSQAIADKKVNDVEQARISVIKFANEGLTALEKIPSFEGDGSIKMACKKAMETYKSIAEKEILVQTDFMLKSENFEKIKKAFDEKSEDSRTKDDVDAFNKAVKEINESVNKSNQASTNAYNKQTELLKIWNETVGEFFDTHTPKY